MALRRLLFTSTGDIMVEKTTLCGDNCLMCPRYNAKTESELQYVAELWYRIGWREKVVATEEIKCSGCSSHKNCTYNLVECTKKHKVSKCNQCTLFSCDKITAMLEKSHSYQEICKEICTSEEYEMLHNAFFNKEYNLNK